jgi:hypothetical protein
VLVPAAGGDPWLGVYVAALWDHGEDCESSCELKDLSLLNSEVLMSLVPG